MKGTAKKIVLQTAALLIGCIITGPIIYALLISFMQPQQILTIPPKLFPNPIHFENYRKAMSLTPLGRYMFNSLLVSGVASTVRVIIACCSAYAFSFFTFKGRNLIFMLFIGTIMIPSDVVLVTNYITISRLGLVNTYLGIMLIYFVSALNIFMMRQNFLSFSKSLKEASHIDGCGNFRFLLQILLPISTPAVTTIFISSFIGIWNIYLWPLIVTNQNNKRTVQIGITMLNFPEGTVYGPIMAASIIVLLPSILIFLIFQKKIVSGIMGGSIKG